MSAEAAKPPLRYGKYDLLGRIGVGGMAEVWRARTAGAEGFTKDLVIKRILPEYTSDETFVRMFIDEARLVARLQHANIVQIFDFDRHGGTYYLAMELVDGRDLRQVERAAAKATVWLSVPAAVYLIAEALKGLHYAHSRTEHGQPLRIVHQDISPHNILISYAGDVKLTDFGIAKVAERSGKTAWGRVKGKLAYMSPEQISGQSVDCRTDIYSMGVVLWELLTANRLFLGPDEREVVRRVQEGLVPLPRQFNPDVPEDLERVVMKMLVPNRERRYQSAGDVARDLCALSCYAYEAQALGDLVRTLFPEDAVNMAGSDQKTMLATPGPAPAPGPMEQKTVMAMAPGPLPGPAGNLLPPPAEAVVAAAPGGFAQGAPPLAPGQVAPPVSPRGGLNPQATVITSSGDGALAKGPTATVSRPQVPQLDLRPASEVIQPPVPPMSGAAAGLLWFLGVIVILAVAGGTFVASKRLLAGAPRKAAAGPAISLFGHRGRLQVVSKPAGATVFVEGIEQPERTPLEVQGEVGKQARLRIQAEGYLPFEAVILFSKEPRPPLNVNLLHPGERPAGVRPPPEAADADDDPSPGESAATEERKPAAAAPERKKARHHRSASPE